MFYFFKIRRASHSYILLNNKGTISHLLTEGLTRNFFSVFLRLHQLHPLDFFLQSIRCREFTLTFRPNLCFEAAKLTLHNHDALSDSTAFRELLVMWGKNCVEQPLTVSSLAIGGCIRIPRCMCSEDATPFVRFPFVEPCGRAAIMGVGNREGINSSSARPHPQAFGFAPPRAPRSGESLSAPTP